MTKPSFVGSIDADPKRPQVFNVRYVPCGKGSRLPTIDANPKRWHVSLDSVTKKQFRRHAKAIKYAVKLARKVKRGRKT